MAILERTREYGVLKALGTRPGKIFNLIILETFYLALISCFFGFAFSLIVNYLFSIYGIDYPEPVDMGGIIISTALAAVTPRSFIIPAVATVLTAILVSLWPALRAARVVPVKAMRAH